MVAPYNVITALPALTWRGISAPPYDLVSFAWTFDQAKRRYLYIDGTGHDNTGREEFLCKARLYFCNGVEFRNDLFPDLWENEWLPALLDGSPGNLTHPILGPIRARVAKVGGELVAKCTSGIVVEVDWVETLEDPTQPTQLIGTGVDVAAVAAAVDSGLSSLGIAYPTGAGSTSLLGAFKAIQGAIFTDVTRVTGAINSAIGTVNSLFDTVDALGSHAAYPVRDGLVQLFWSFSNLQTTMAKNARATATKVTSTDTTLDAFAAQVGNTLQDVMGLNLSALRTPLIPKGTTLTYFTGK